MHAAASLTAPVLRLKLMHISLKLRGGGYSQVACFQQLLSAITMQEVVHVTALQDVCTHARQGSFQI